MHEQKGFSTVFLMIGLVFFVGIGAAFYLGQRSNQSAPPKTEEVQQYPHVSASQSTPLASAVTLATKNWTIYQNTTYSYQIKYPKDQEVSVQPGNPIPVEESTILEIGLRLGKPDYKIAKIEVVDPTIDLSSEPKELSSKFPKRTNLPLKDFAETLWNINKEDVNKYGKDEVGNLSETTIDGTKAYQFTIDGVYNAPNGGGTAFGEKMNITLSENNKRIYIFMVPVSTPLLSEVISTFKFTK